MADATKSRNPSDRKLITQERLKELLHYAPETGVFTRRDLPGRLGPRKAGDVVGTKPRKGYQDIRIGGQLHRAHRLAWLYMTGEWPVDQIDHEDMDRLNNRWKNLRQADNSKNTANRKRQSNNKSGFKGVSFCKSTGLWRATATCDGKQITIGRFKSPADAHMAYEAKFKELFGAFARAV